MISEATFTVKVKGDYSNEEWAGAFKMKTRLSYRETLKQDQIRRELLGPDPTNNASEDAKGIAQVFSFLGVYLISAPRWWTESNNGLDMADNNVAPEVYQKAIEKLAESIKEREAEAEAARKAVEKDAAAQSA